MNTIIDVIKQLIIKRAEQQHKRIKTYKKLNILKVNMQRTKHTKVMIKISNIKMNKT